MTPQSTRHGYRNRLRISGGSLRSRVIRFPRVEGLRPTGDRIRETLFSWLQHEMAGAHCLDLYAGSGALGIEALSRGASMVQFVEHNQQIAAALRSNLQQLGLTRAKLAVMPAARWMQTVGQQPGFNLVFIDPPFRDRLAISSCSALLAADLLAPGALLYIEQQTLIPDAALPAGFSLLRCRQAGQVACHLLRYQSNGPTQYNKAGTE